MNNETWFSLPMFESATTSKPIDPVTAIAIIDKKIHEPEFLTNPEANKFDSSVNPIPSISTLSPEKKRIDEQFTERINQLYGDLTKWEEARKLNPETPLVFRPGVMKEIIKLPVYSSQAGASLATKLVSGTAAPIAGIGKFLYDALTGKASFEEAVEFANKTYDTLTYEPSAEIAKNLSKGVDTVVGAIPTLIGHGAKEFVKTGENASNKLREGLGFPQPGRPETPKETAARQELAGMVLPLGIMVAAGLRFPSKQAKITKAFKQAEANGWKLNQDTPVPIVGASPDQVVRGILEAPEVLARNVSETMELFGPEATVATLQPIITKLAMNPEHAGKIGPFIDALNKIKPAEIKYLYTFGARQEGKGEKFTSFMDYAKFISFENEAVKKSTPGAFYTEVLKNLAIYRDPPNVIIKPLTRGAGGQFNARTNEIYLDPARLTETAKTYNRTIHDQIYRTLSHELQHETQKAKGSLPTLDPGDRMPKDLRVSLEKDAIEAHTKAYENLLGYSKAINKDTSQFTLKDYLGYANWLDQGKPDLTTVKTSIGGQKVKKVVKISELQEQAHQATRAYTEGLKPSSGPSGSVPSPPSTPSRVKSYFDSTQSQTQSYADPKLHIGHELAKAVFDSAYPCKEALRKAGPLGRAAVRDRDLVNGVDPKVKLIVDEKVNAIYGDLDGKSIDLMHRYIESYRGAVVDQRNSWKRTNVDPKTKPIKHPAALTGAEYESYIRNFAAVENLTTDQAANIHTRAMQWFKDLEETTIQRLLDEGLIDQREFLDLREAGPYAPRRFLAKLDPQLQYRGVKGSVSSSGLKPLGEGDYGMLMNNYLQLFREAVARTEMRIAQNKANKSLLALGEELGNQRTLSNPMIGDNAGIVIAAKPLINSLGEPKTNKKGQIIYEKAPEGYGTIHAMVNGKPRPMFIPDEFVPMWVEAPPTMKRGTATILNILTLGSSKIVKQFATGIFAPEFGLANIFRDAMFSWLTTDVASPHAPIAAFQYLNAYRRTFKAAWTEKGAAIDYVKEGGGMEFLTMQASKTQSQIKPTGNLGKAWYFVERALTKLNRFSELWTRLAVRDMALRKGLDPLDATYIARSYLDYNLKGTLTQPMETFFPYFGAAMQASKGLLRAAKDNPPLFIWKMSQVGMTSMGLYWANRLTNPEAFKNVPAEVMESNWVVTTPFNETDPDGNVRHMVFKIPKEQSMRWASTLFDHMAAAYFGDDFSQRRISSSIMDMFPYVPGLSSSPFITAATGYVTNADFYRSFVTGTPSQIFRQSGKYLPEPLQEIDSQTSPVSVLAAKGLSTVFPKQFSPARLQWSTEQFITRNNPYVQLVSAGVKQLFPAMTIEEQKALFEKVAETPGIRRFIYWTNPLTEHKQGITEAGMQEESWNVTLRRNTDNIAKQYLQGTVTEEDVTKFIESIHNADDAKRMTDRFIKWQQLKGIPNQSVYLGIAGLSPRPRAKYFVKALLKAPVNERMTMLENASKVPGFVTKQFARYLGEELENHPELLEQLQGE